MLPLGKAEAEARRVLVEPFIERSFKEGRGWELGSEEAMKALTSCLCWTTGQPQILSETPDDAVSCCCCLTRGEGREK